MIDRTKFLQQFARRLVDLMVREGFGSDRSSLKVEVSILARFADCSYQMARRYVLGDALPDIHVIPKIANWLNTTPGWLLFGESNCELSSQKTGAIIEIEPSLLKYILAKSIPILNLENNEESINFVVECIYTASHLETDKKNMNKIIDMMFSSAILVTKALPKRKKYEKC